MAQNSIGVGTRWAITAVTLSLLMFAAVEWAWQSFAPPHRIPSGSHSTLTDLLRGDRLHVAVHVAGGILALLLSTWVVFAVGREAVSGPGGRPAGGSARHDDLDMGRVFASSQQAAAELGLPVLVVARPRIGRPGR